MKNYFKKNKWIPGSVFLVSAVMSSSMIVHDTHSWPRFMAGLAELNRAEKPQEEHRQETIRPQAINIPIFIYHSITTPYPGKTALQDAYDITPELLEAHLQYLESHGYTTISFDDLADYFDTGKPLPPHPVMLNFDDGWKNQFVYAFPLLRKYHDIATFFVFTNAVGSKHFLSWEEIEEMVQSGMRMGAHTKTHPFLDRMTDADKINSEIMESKKILENRLHQPVSAFAYPFGSYDDRIVSAVKEAGFRTARTIYRGVHHKESDRYTLKGILVSDSMEDFVRMLEAAQKENAAAR